MLKIFDIAIEQPALAYGDPICYEIDPAAAYPAALRDMQEAAMRADQLDSALRTILAPVQTMLTDTGIALALTPRGEVSDDALPVRAQLLEAARLWFTERLHQAVNRAPMSLRITKKVDFRL
jgi:hypothetical protein